MNINEQFIKEELPEAFKKRLNRPGSVIKKILDHFENQPVENPPKSEEVESHD